MVGGTATIPDRANGVFFSPDGGATWQHRSNGLPRRSGFTNLAYDVLSLAIHPSNGNILWASTLDSQSGVGGTGSLYKTIDGGLNWTVSATGITPGADIRAILVDPDNPLRLYAAGAGTEANPGSVFRSSDGGATWQSASVGLPAVRFGDEMCDGKTLDDLARAIGAPTIDHDELRPRPILANNRGKRLLDEARRLLDVLGRKRQVGEHALAPSTRRPGRATWTSRKSWGCRPCW